jgi:hypothetical protein
MNSMAFAPRASAGVVRGSVRPSAARHTPTARLAAFNGVVSDRVACIHGNGIFQVRFQDCQCYPLQPSVDRGLLHMIVVKKVIPTTGEDATASGLGRA